MSDERIPLMSKKSAECDSNTGEVISPHCQYGPCQLPSDGEKLAIGHNEGPCQEKGHCSSEEDCNSHGTLGQGGSSSNQGLVILPSASGSLRPYQVLVLTLLSLSIVGSTGPTIIYSFTVLEPGAFRCDWPECRDEDFQSSNPDSCKKPILNSTVVGVQCPLSLNDTSLIVGFESCNSQKDSFVYEKFQFESTLVTELDLVCDQQYKVALVGTFSAIGWLLGSLVVGFTLDQFGRKPVLFVSIGLAGTIYLLAGFFSNYWAYALLTLLGSTSVAPSLLAANTLCFEIVQPQHTNMVGNLMGASAAVGFGLLGVLAYFIREWKVLQAVAALIALSPVTFWFLIPESPRWLLTQGKKQELNKVLEKLFKLQNGDFSYTKTTTNGHSKRTKSNINEALNWTSLFTTRPLLSRILILSTVWTVTSMLYFGVALSMTVIGGDIFVNFILGALIEIPGCIVCILLADNMGRKPTLMVSLFVSGPALIGSAFLEPGSWLKLTLVLLGKMAVSSATNVIYFYICELFPTPIRGAAFSTGSAISKIGSIAAPQMALFLPALTFDELPLILFGLSAFLGSFLTLCLPETLGCPLPDTLEETRLVSSKKIWSWWNAQRLDLEVARQKQERKKLSHK